MLNVKKSMRFVYCLILFLGCFFDLYSQAYSTQIPYELYGGKMIVKMKINGEEKRFIFDTGASKSSLTAEFCRENNLNATDSILVNDVTSVSAYYKQTRVNSIQTLDGRIKFSGLTPIIMPEPSPVRCYDVVGFIGSDLLAQSICTIDSENKMITISSAETPSAESLRYSHGFTHTTAMPIFDLQISGQDLKVLFDSGSGAFMNLKDSDFERLRKARVLQVLKSGHGSKSFGVSGVIDRSSTYQVHIPEMRLGPVRIKDIVAETSNPPYTLLGVRLLEHGRVVIDYPRRRLYFLPFEEGPIKPLFKRANFDITVKDGLLQVAHIWQDMEGKIAEGDVVTHINGVQTRTYEFCEILSGIKELREKGPKILTIKTSDERVIELEYKSEEIQL